MIGDFSAYMVSFCRPSHMYSVVVMYITNCVMYRFVIILIKVSW